MPGGGVLQAFGRAAHLLGLAGRRCLLCAETYGPVAAVPAWAEGLCPDCARKLAPREGGFCPRCGARFGLPDYAPDLCGDCRTAPPPWKRLFFHAAYGDELRELILHFKFRSGLTRLGLFQRMALSAWERRGEHPAPDVVVPVPLHPKRLAWRGFNQSLEIARLLARREGLVLSPQALVRVRNTTPQSTLPPEQREENLAGAFRAEPALVSGRRVLLVDDVVTTGSTLRACTLELLAAGAVAVDALVVARV